MHAAYAVLRVARSLEWAKVRPSRAGVRRHCPSRMLDRRTETSTSAHLTRDAEEAPSGLLRLAMLAPFATRSFRFQWPADLLTSWAFEMETIILGWYVLVETGSVLWLTMFGAWQYLGTLVAPLYGVVGDRLGHKSLLLGMRAAYAVFGGTLMTLAFLHAVSPLAVLIVATLMGLVRPSDLGVRSALIAETMPAPTLISALSISRTTTDSARIGGALLGASVVTFFGLAPAYVIITGFYVIGTLLMLGDTAPLRRISLAMTPEEAAGKSPWRDLKEGIAHTWNTPVLLAFVSIAFLMNLVAFPITNGLMPYVAKNIYALDQTGLGFLVASFASGALIGSIALSYAGANVALPRMMIVATFIWYALLLAFAQMAGPAGGVRCLLLAGFVQSVCTG